MSKIDFLTTLDFEKDYKRLKKKYHSLPEDLRLFKKEFTQNQDMGVDLGNNLRKIRIAIKSKGKGKSSGARIITYSIVASIVQKAVILTSGVRNYKIPNSFDWWKYSVFVVLKINKTYKVFKTL